MKKLFMMALMAVALVSCSKEPGSLSGNVYYKYNNYVGNKPDAGTTVKMYSLDNKEVTHEASADVQGNYKVSSIVPGDYLLIVQSKNTTSLMSEVLEGLLENKESVKKVFDIDMEKNALKINEILKLQIEKKQALSSSDYSSVEYSKLGDKISDIEEGILGELPDDFRKEFSIYAGYAPKLEIKKITIEEAKETQNNTDFGITYN